MEGTVLALGASSVLGAADVRGTVCFFLSVAWSLAANSSTWKHFGCWSLGVQGTGT